MAWWPWAAIPVTIYIDLHAYMRGSLTPTALIVATFTAAAHAIHPWPVFFTLLAGFFLAGSQVTKVKHAEKAKLTTSAGGGSSLGAEGDRPPPRNHIQVLANSASASVCILLHAYYLHFIRKGGPDGACVAFPPSTSAFESWFDLLPYAVLAHYAAVTADTFSSELGILAESTPVLVTSLFKAQLRRVPKGVNGAVTIEGTVAGALGAEVVGMLAAFFTPLCVGNVLKESTGSGKKSSDFDMEALAYKLGIIIAMMAVGVVGSLVDSVLGATLQASVVEGRTGKIVEGEGGGKVMLKTTDLSLRPKERGGEEKSRKLVSGADVLSNNGVNLLMASITSVLGMVAALAIGTIRG